MKENIDKLGKYLSMRVFVTGENLEKLKEIQLFLNSQNDVISGDVEPWTKAAVYELLFNSAIEDFEIERQEDRTSGGLNMDLYQTKINILHELLGRMEREKKKQNVDFIEALKWAIFMLENIEE